jgi:DNA-binding transcriptional LysR family regulator
MEATMKWDERIGRRVKLRDLNVLLAVVQWRSMARAAEQLAVSQPVVSKAISDLERTLGVPLLDRSRRGIEPTPFGQALLSRGAVVFDELRQAVKELESLADPTLGEVRIAAAGAMIGSLLPSVIARVYRRHPKFIIHVKETLAGATLYAELRERRVDFVVGRILQPLDDRDLTAEILFNDPLFVVAGRLNPLARKRNLKLANLIDQPWIMPPAEAVGGLIRDTFREAGVSPPEPVIVSPSLSMYFELLNEGPLLAMMPRSMLVFAPARHTIKILSVKLPVKSRPVGIITLRGRTLSPAARLFMQTVREVVRPLTGRDQARIERRRPSDRPG